MSGWACIVYHSDLWCLDVAGAPGNPHVWNLKKLKVQTALSEHHMRLWLHMVAPLFRIILETWILYGALVAEHPRYDWSLKFPLYTGYRHMDDSHTLASKKKLWTHSIEDFVAFASGQDPMKNGPFYQKLSHIVTNSLQGPAPKTGCSRACRMNLIEP